MGFFRSGRQSAQHYADANGIPFVAAPRAWANDQVFLDDLFNRFRPTVAFSVYCTEIFDDGFLQRFDQVINYHNGALPMYKGLRASAWAIAMGEDRIGYTFHRIDKGIDSGNILIQHSLPIEPSDTTDMVELRLVQHAHHQIPELLDCIVKRIPGYPQTGSSSYYAQSDYINIRELFRPDHLEAKTLINLPRAFGPIKLHLSNQWYVIKKINLAKQGQLKAGHFYFHSRDGVLIEACEFAHPFYFIFKIQGLFKRLLRRISLNR